MSRSAVVVLGVALLGALTDATLGVTPLSAQAPSSGSATWTDIGSLSMPHHFLGLAASADGRVFATGGVDESGTAMTLVEAYSPGSGTWSAVAPVPEARYAHASVRGSNGLIYVIGGMVDNNPAASVRAYDPSSNAWSPAADMTTSRVGLAAAVVGGKIYVTGGVTGTRFNRSYLASGEVYDPATNTWSPLASMQEPRYFHAMAAGPDGRIYAIGGTNAMGWMVSTVEAYDPTTKTWTYVASLPTGRYAMGAATGGDGLIYVVGGFTSAVEPSVLTYDVRSDTWSDAASLNHGRLGAGVTASPDGHIYAAGGQDYVVGELSSAEALGTAPVAAPPLEIAVRVKSGDNAPINRGSKGNTPVVVLSSATFDATTIDRSTVLFAGAPPLPIGGETADVNGDGLPDMTFHFSTQALDLPDGTTQACMAGKTTDGKSFQGCDSVRLVK
jgi:N-acetylneuraminic acid mutarotase